MSFTGDFEFGLPSFTEAKASVDVELLHTRAEQLIGIITHAIPPKRIDGEGDGYWVYSPDASVEHNFFAPIAFPASRPDAVLEWNRLDSETLITTDGIIPKWFGTFQYYEKNKGNRAFLRYSTDYINLHGWDSTPEPHEVLLRKYVHVGVIVPDGIDEISAEFYSTDKALSWQYTKMHQATRLHGIQTELFNNPYEQDYQPSPDNIQQLRETAEHFFMELKILELLHSAKL